MGKRHKVGGRGGGRKNDGSGEQGIWQSGDQILNRFLEDVGSSGWAHFAREQLIFQIVVSIEELICSTSARKLPCSESGRSQSIEHHHDIKTIIV